MWVTEVEGRSIAELAAEIGTSANTASALCLRARDGLKLAWLQAHVERRAKNAECAWMLDHLASYTRGRLPQAQLERAEAHLASCESCEATRRRIAFIGAGLRASILFGGTGAGLLAARAALGIGTATAAHAGAVAVVPAARRCLSSLSSILKGFLSKGWIAQAALGVGAVVMVGTVGFAGFSYATTGHRGATVQDAVAAPAPVPTSDSAHDRDADTFAEPHHERAGTAREPPTTSRPSKAPTTASPTATATARAIGHRGQRPRPLRHPRSRRRRRHADTAHADANLHADADRDPDAHGHAHTDRHPDADADAHGHANAHGHPDADRRRPPDSHADDAPTPTKTPTPTDTPTPTPSPTPTPTQTCYTIIDLGGIALIVCQ